MIRVDHQWIEKFKQLLRCRIILQSEVCIELAMSGLPCAKHFDGDFRLLQHGTKTSCLCSRVGMSGNMENQEWRDAFSFRHVGDG